MKTKLKLRKRKAQMKMGETMGSFATKGAINSSNLTRMERCKFPHSRSSSSLREKRRAQMKMGETIAILFIFFMFVIFGFIFYAKISRTTYITELEEKNELAAIQSAQKIAYLPEVQCSTKNVLDENCYDVLKMEAFSRIIDNDEMRAYYYDHFGYSSVVVRQIYPKTDDTWILYNNTLEDSTSIFTPIPISLYYPGEDVNYLGVIEIRYYALTIS